MILILQALPKPDLLLSRQPQYYPALTGVRALAAWLVFLTHFNPFEAQQKQHAWAFAFVHQGHFGVPIFFVLSGFLIATRYKGSAKLSLGWARRYMQNRVARIYPLYFLLTALTFLLYQANPKLDILNAWQHYNRVDKLAVVVLNFTFLRGFFNNYFFTGISQGWSLTAEETFYVVAPFVLLTTKGYYMRLAGWCLGLLAFGLILVKLCAPFADPLRGLFASPEFMFEWTFFGHSLEFMAGIGLAFLVAKEERRDLPGSWRTYGGVVWIVACAAFIATMQTQQAPIAPAHLKILTINFLLPPGICLFFYGLLKEATSCRRLLETKVFDQLGKSSYAFYLVHLGIFSQVLKWVHAPLLVCFLATLLLSHTLFLLIEEPLHKRLKAARVVR